MLLGLVVNNGRVDRQVPNALVRVLLLDGLVVELFEVQGVTVLRVGLVLVDPPDMVRVPVHVDVEMRAGVVRHRRRALCVVQRCGNVESGLTAVTAFLGNQLLVC